MAQLIIFREKSMLGMIALMDCYVNDRIVCKVKNGEQVSCEVSDEIIGFKCNMYNNPMSDTVYLDLTDGKTVTIKVKQGAIKPSVKIADKSAITDKPAVISQTSAARTKSQGDLRSALRTMKKSVDVTNAFQSDADAGISIFSPTKEVGDYFAVDENNQLWAVGKGIFSSLKNAIPHHYSDIVDFELIEDDSCIIKGGIGRAVVGGMLFGGVGAIVGGSTGKKKVKQTCSNLMVKITVNNMDAPVEYIKLISSTTEKNSMIYRGAYQDAQEIISLLQLICSQQSEIGTDSQNNLSSISAADEIRKFKELMDDGIITEEEFLAKKKELLGL